jgi:uncharacterized membrane protein
MLRLFLVEVGGATFQFFASANLLLLAQRTELLIAASRAKTNVTQVPDMQGVGLAYNMASFPQTENTLASCLAS